MKPDLSPVVRGEKKAGEVVAGWSVDDLRQATLDSLAQITALIEQCSDADIVFEPVDPEADDPFAKPGEEKIGWTLGHLVAHVTASSEETAAIASVLARGIAYPREPRLRYETEWREIDSRDKALQRLAESRRMRLGYLDAFPDQPHRETFRELSERGLEYFGPLNAFGQFASGLAHEVGHHEQFREAFRQAQAAHA